MIISTDPAHSLSDALEIQLEPEPSEIDTNLWHNNNGKNGSCRSYRMAVVVKWIIRTDNKCVEFGFST